MTTIQKTFVTILILILLGVSVYIFIQTLPPIEDQTPPTTIPSNGICGFLISSHAPNAKVALTKPITIAGTINNENSQTRACSWQLFEGQAGTAEAFAYVNNQWKSISKRTPVPVPNWMTTQTTFVVEIRIDTGTMNIADGTALKVVFTEENASGEPPVDTYTLPLISTSGELDEVPVSIPLSVYIQDTDKLATSCNVTKKVTFQVPKTTAVADASLKILFSEELSQYGVYKSIIIENKVAKILLASDTTPSGRSYASLSSCEVGHITSVLKDTLTQYNTIQSIELYSPQGKIVF